MIYIISGLPGAGKTMLSVGMFAIDKWKRNPYHRVYSNFPIQWHGISSYKWDPAYVQEDLYDATVIVDESYRDYNSRKSVARGNMDGKLDDNAHLCFATSRHNGMDFVFIAQSVQRIDTVIREIANEIFVVHARRIPGIDRPLWFYVETFDGVEQLKARAISKEAVLRRFRKFFHKDVALAYDTHQYRKKSKTEFLGEPWYPMEIKHGKLYRFRNYVSTLSHNCWNRINPIPRIRNRFDDYRSLLTRTISNRLVSDKERNYDLFEPIRLRTRIQRKLEIGMIKNYHLIRSIFWKCGINFDHMCDDLGFT